MYVSSAVKRKGKCNRCPRALSGLGITTCEIREGGARVCTDSDAGAQLVTIQPANTGATAAPGDGRARRSMRVLDSGPSSPVVYASRTAPSYGYSRYPSYGRYSPSYYVADQPPSSSTADSGDSISDVLQQPVTADNFQSLIARIPPMGWAAIALGGFALLNRKRGR